MSTFQGLEKDISGEISTQLEDLQKYSRDASIFAVTPKAVIAPKTVDDIKKLVEYATKTPDASLTVRSGGSDMSGGPLSESLILDMNRHFNNLIRLEALEATVQPGMFYRDFEPKVAEQHALLPSYPASKNLCTLGGMVANNSGGEKTLAYGKTEKYVKALKVVLSDGNEYTLKPLDADEVAAKMRETTFEGKLYTKLATLIEANESLIQKARPNVSKNSSGYNLWDVWNGHVFDMTKLFVGSQGTLGIITEITFRLISPKPHSRMLVVSLRTIKDLATIVQRVLRHNPESFESYDKHTLSLALKYFPELLAQMKSRNLAKLMWQLLPDIKLVLTGGLPEMILIAEFTGDDEEEITKRAKAAAASIQNLVAAARVTKSEEEAEKYWTVRRESFSLLRNKMRGRHTAPFIDDFIIQPKHLPEFLPKLEEILSPYDITYTVAGHVGNGNFHIIPLMDFTDESQRAIIPELSKKVYDLVFTYDGSMSAEHNDGLVRSHYLPQMFGPEVYKLFEEVKHMFDPKNIFNPGKKVGFDWEYSKKHIIRE